MSNLIVVAHVVTGLAGIAAGAVVVAGISGRRRVTWVHAVFLVMTLAACGTGFVSLPTLGVTSAQLVGFYLILAALFYLLPEVAA